MTASLRLPTTRPSPAEVVDVGRVQADLEAQSWSVFPALLHQNACTDLIALYDQPTGFRKTVVMARHSFGRGEYKYFDTPLPPLIGELRAALYPGLAEIANRWMAALGLDKRYPDQHDAYRAECTALGQTKPTPLILKYGAGDYNCLHQDLYGDEVFPLQIAVLLSAPGRDFEGGEFVLSEQRPRQQSIARVVPLSQGDAVVFPVNERPNRGARGYHRLKLRHGVSEIRSGRRYAAGIIFHDART